jgi:CheY-like chemotaxis protein
VDELPAPSWAQQLEAFGVALAASRRILVVDDEAENLEVLAALIEDEFQVSKATSGQAALDLLKPGDPFAVVISDQRMPGMTGIELLAEFERRSPQTVRMMLTAYSDLGPLIAAVNDGSVYRFFLKPWNPDEMRSAITDAVWLHSAQAALNQLVDLLGQRKRDLQATLENLQRVQGELLAAERMTTVGRFSAGIAHNVRNSLTVMMNLLELVQQNPVGNRVVASAQRAFQTLDALLRLVNDVNNLARGRLHAIARVPVEMEPYLDQLLTAFRVDPLGRDRSVVITRDPSTRVLLIDPARIRQALLALMRSVAHTTAPEAPMELVVHSLKDRRTCFEVMSPPRGLASPGWGEIATRRLAAAAAPTFAQIELGLEISRVVADAHGGKVVVRPRPERRESAVQLWVADADPEVDNP